MTTTALTFFAVPDYSDTSRMSYWRMSDRGLVSWPPQAVYGPQGAEMAARLTWFQRVVTAIVNDPYIAAARFSVLKVRCCCCGRDLREPESRVLGIGPDCRADVPRDVLARMSEAVGRYQAASTSTWAEPLFVLSGAA